MSAGPRRSSRQMPVEGMIPDAEADNRIQIDRAGIAQA
jgi:hypothetical protein